MANALTKIKAGAIGADAIDSPDYAAASIDNEHLADNAVGLAEMAGLARGKIIYGDASGDPAALAVGSNGQVLKSDGTDIAWATDAGGAALTGSTNNTITTVTGANAIQGEANLTFDGDKLQVSRSSGGTSGHFYANARESNILIQNDARTWKIVNYDYGDNGSDHLGFHDGTDDRLVIQNDGNVGIGTTTAGAKLHVNSGTSNTCATFQSSDSGAGINLTDNSARSSIEQNGTTLKVSADTGAEHANSDIRLQVDGSTKATVDSTGDLTISDGDLVIGTAGHGIDFSATSDATGKSNELLDDYEEGSWTPAIQGLDNTPTYYNLVGKYTKIGNVVKCQGFIQIGSTKASFANTGLVFKVAGLPYAVSGVGYAAAIGNCNWQGFDWVGASQSTYGHNDDTQLTAGIVSSTVNTFRTMGQAEYYMGEVKNLAMDNKGFILEWDMTYFTAT